MSISVTREGVSCPQATKRDEARIAELSACWNGHTPTEI